jgi:hypothetical protein
VDQQATREASGGNRRSRALASARRILAPVGRNGAPLAAIAVVALVTMVALVIVANDRPRSAFTAFAEFSVTRDGCALEATRTLNASRCDLVGPGVFRLTFVKSLRHTTPIISRGSCCPGRVAASVVSDRSVIVAFPPRRAPIRASVLLP